MALINGRFYEWGDLNIMIGLSPLSSTLQEISWDDEMQKESIYGIGRTPIGYSKGQYKASGKLTMLMEEYNLLNAMTIKNAVSGIFNMPPFNITIMFANYDELPVVIILQDCIFTKKSVKTATGDKSVKVELDFEITGDVIENGISSSGQNLLENL